MTRPLIGCGYRPAMFGHLMHHLDLVEVWEHTVDGMVGAGEKGIEAMARFAGVGPVTLHSLDVSIGSTAATSQPGHLAELARIVRAAGAAELSDHLGFTQAGGRHLGHFAPLWRVDEQLDLVVANVDHVQHELGCRLLLENIALEFDPGGDIGHAEFLNEVTARTGCGVLLDLTNLAINDRNGFLDAERELTVLDLTSVVGVHLAGGGLFEGRAVDSHAFPVPEGDLSLLRRILPELVHCRSIIVERDGRFDEAAEVVDDLRAVRRLVVGEDALTPIAIG